MDLISKSLEHRQPKILFFDIETSPILGYTWGIYEQNVVHIERDSHFLSFVAKWGHQDKIISYSLADFPTFKKDIHDDEELVEKLYSLLEEADIVVAHNGDRFDIKKSNVRFIDNGFRPPSSYVSVDTLKVAKRYFAFPSNKLNDLAQRFNIGKKIDTGGFELWLRCMKGERKAFAEMKRYNVHDVVLLEKVYLKLRPWIVNHPNLNIYSNKIGACPKCGSSNVIKYGRRYSSMKVYQRYVCNDCGGQSTGVENIGTTKPLIK